MLLCLLVSPSLVWLRCSKKKKEVLVSHPRWLSSLTTCWSSPLCLAPFDTSLCRAALIIFPRLSQSVCVCVWRRSGIHVVSETLWGFWRGMRAASLSWAWKNTACSVYEQNKLTEDGFRQTLIGFLKTGMQSFISYPLSEDFILLSHIKPGTPSARVHQVYLEFF